MADRRLYAQFTLDYADSHKIAPLSDAAFRAHVRMILWSRRMLTDGRVPSAMALVLAGKRKTVLQELTTNDAEHPSLTRDEHGDYWLHDFLEHNSSRAAVEAKQEINRANGARGGRAKAKRIASETVSDSLSETKANLYTETETETNTPLTPFEGSPVPVDNPVESEPPDRCPRHLGVLHPPACGGCREARIAHDAWARTAAAAAAPPPRPPAWDPATHCEHGQLLGACDACDYESRHVAEVIHATFGASA